MSLHLARRRRPRILRLRSAQVRARCRRQEPFGSAQGKQAPANRAHCHAPLRNGNGRRGSETPPYKWQETSSCPTGSPLPGVGIAQRALLRLGSHGFLEGDVNATLGELEFAALEEFFDGE